MNDTWQRFRRFVASNVFDPQRFGGDGTLTAARVRRTIKQHEHLLDRTYDGLLQDLQGEMSNHSGGEIDNALPDLLVCGSPAADWLAGQRVGLSTRWAAWLRLGLVAGRTSFDMAADLQAPERAVREGRSDPYGVAVAQYATLAVTAASAAHNAAILASVRRQPDKFAGVVQRAAENASDDCRAGSGRAWRLLVSEARPLKASGYREHSDPLPELPHRWQCRCRWEPIPKEEPK